MPIKQIKAHIAKKLDIDISDIKLSPNPKFGDLTVECFKPGKSARALASKIKLDKIIQEINIINSYLNFKINYQNFAPKVLENILEKQKKSKQKKQTIMLEFAHPNTHKAFHIGHLRNIITGESLVRILENAGYKIIRANYQGDIGLHIAKCLWGIKDNFQNKNIENLSKAYIFGNKNYKKNKQEIDELNQKIYKQDASIKKIYQETRKYSLDYFDKIYKRLDTKFDRLYFESEVFDRGKEIVLKNKIFQKSKDAIIFPGKKYGLHNRVFINSQGNPTYEAKDLALAELQMQEYNPDKIIHLVGPEQTEYFKVIFKALEQIMPKYKNKELHLPYGWVRLKKGKMSSRLGNVVLGEWLIDEIKKQGLTEKIALAAVKYSMLKSTRNKDIAFDIKESISLSGNSGSYLLYTYARIKSILRKSDKKARIKKQELKNQEKNLIFKLSLFSEITQQAAVLYEPSLIAKYLFELAQEFSSYYHQVQIRESEFRLALIKAIAFVLKNGLYLLGVGVVEKM